MRRMWMGGLALLLLGFGQADARSLQAVSQSGYLALCAHPNALPFASKKAGDLPGFQLELGEALASKLGVSLSRQWVVNSFQYRRAGCDIVLDAIADKGALAEVGLRMTRPYYRGGIVLALPARSEIAALDGLIAGGRPAGVLVGSLAAMALQQRQVPVTPYAFEEDMMAALVRGEVAAVAVTPTALGWHNHQHPDQPMRSIAAFADDPALNWNVAAGLLRPDEPLMQRIDAALEELLKDGTITRIYARYGIALQPPR